MLHGAGLIGLLILHGLVAVALLGAVTHQAVALLFGGRTSGGFAARYAAVSAPAFTNAIAVLFTLNVVLGALLYPAYRLDVRIALEEMQLGWVIGLFEVKEHFGGIGLALLPLYLWSWKGAREKGTGGDCIGISLLLAFIVWFGFLAGHLVNNVRGL